MIQFMCMLLAESDDEELYESDTDLAFPAKLRALKQLVSVVLVMID